MINYRLLGGLIRLTKPPLYAGVRCACSHYNNNYENDFQDENCNHNLANKCRAKSRAPPCSVSDPPVSKIVQSTPLSNFPKMDLTSHYSDHKYNKYENKYEKYENEEETTSNAQCIINIYMEGEKGYSTTVALKDLDLRPEDIREHIRRERSAVEDMDDLPQENGENTGTGLSIAKRLENFLLGFFKTSNERTRVAQGDEYDPFPKLTNTHNERAKDMRSIETFIKHSELTPAKWAQSEPEIASEREDVAKLSKSYDNFRTDAKRHFRLRSVFNKQPRLRDENAYGEKIDRVVRLAMRRPPLKGIARFISFWKNIFGEDHFDYSHMTSMKFFNRNKLKQKRLLEHKAKSGRVKRFKYLDNKHIFNPDCEMEPVKSKPAPVTDFKIFEMSTKGVEEFVERRNTPGLRRRKPSLFYRPKVSKQQKSEFGTDSKCGKGSKSDKESTCDKKCDENMKKTKDEVKQIFSNDGRSTKKCSGKSQKTEAASQPKSSKDKLNLCKGVASKAEAVSKPEVPKKDLCKGVKIKESKPEVTQKAVAKSKANDADVLIPGQFLQSFIKLVTKLLNLVRRGKPKPKGKIVKQVLKTKKHSTKDVSCKALLKSQSEAKPEVDLSQPCKPDEDLRKRCIKKADAKKEAIPCATESTKKSGKKIDPCKSLKSKKSICKDDEKQDPCAKKADPCAKKTESRTKKADPCAKKTDPCAKKDDPCAKKAESRTKKADPCAKKADPCVKKADPCAKKADPCAKKADPCAKKADPCAKKADPCAKKADPCAKKDDPCAKKADPCAKNADPCAKKADPCAKKAESRTKKEDPCAKKADPCAKKADLCAKKADPCAKKDSCSEDECKPPPCKFNANFNKQCDKTFDVRKAVLKKKTKPCKGAKATTEQTSCGGDTKKDSSSKLYHTSSIFRCKDEGEGNKCESPEDIQKISKGEVGTSSKCLSQRCPDVKAEPIEYPSAEETKDDCDDPRQKTVKAAVEPKTDLMEEIEHLLKKEECEVKKYFVKGYKNLEYFRYGKRCFYDVNTHLCGSRLPQPKSRTKK